MRVRTDLGTVTIRADVAPGLRLEVDVCLWASGGDGYHRAEWSLPNDLSNRYQQLRWVGDAAVVIGVRRIAKAYDYWVDAPDSNPVRKAIEDRAQEAADKALMRWLECASSAEGGASSHDRDNREDAAE